MEVISPPITEIAKELWVLFPVKLKAKGERARILVAFVTKIARNFSMQAQIICFLSLLTKFLQDSYNKMELFTEVPNKIISAIHTFTFTVFPEINKKAKAPKNAGGMARSKSTGSKKDSNWAARIR